MSDEAMEERGRMILRMRGGRLGPYTPANSAEEAFLGIVK